MIEPTDFIGLFLGFVIYAIIWLFEFFKKLNAIFNSIEKQPVNKKHHEKLKINLKRFGNKLN